MVPGLWHTHDPNFGCILILKVQRTSMSFKSSFGALEDAAGFWLRFGILILIWILVLVFIKPWFKFWLTIRILKLQRSLMSFQSSFGAAEDAGGSWLRFGILILIWIWLLVFDISTINILVLKVQRKSMSFKSSFGTLEDTGGSWLVFCILILILIWSLVFNTPMCWILALYFDFEGANNPCPLSPDLDEISSYFLEKFLWFL